MGRKKSAKTKRTRRGGSGPINLGISDAVRLECEAAANLIGVSMDAIIARVLMIVAYDATRWSVAAHVTLEFDASGPRSETTSTVVQPEATVSLGVLALADALLTGGDIAAVATRVVQYEARQNSDVRTQSCMMLRIAHVLVRITEMGKQPTPGRVAMFVADEMIDDGLSLPLGCLSGGRFLRPLEELLGLPRRTYDRGEPDDPHDETIAEMVELGHVRVRMGPGQELQYQITSRGRSVALALIPANIGRRRIAQQ